MDVTQIVQLLTNVGFPVVFTGGILWLAYKYLPEWFSKNLENQAKLVESSTKMADAMCGMSERMDQHLAEAKEIKASTAQLKEAAAHGGNAVHALACIPALSAGNQVQPHVEALKECVRR